MPEEKISKSKKIDKAISFKSSYFVLRAFFSALPLLYAMVFYEANAEQLPVKNYTIADGLARDYVNRIRQDSHGFMWFCTSEGISRFDGYGFTNYGLSDGLPHRMINDFLETRDGL
jgi:ligand-binding sensor domain-containing protein